MTAPTPTRSAVLMVTGAYFPELSGGGLQAQTMTRALRQWLNFEVFTTCTDRSLPHHQFVEGTRVTRVYVDVGRPFTKITAAARTVWFFLARSRSFDVVHLHGFSQKSILIVLLARLVGKPVIITIHTAGHDEPEGVRRLGRLAYWCYSRADLYLAISEAMADHYRSAGLPPDRLRVLPNGVDVERFRPAEGDQRDHACRSLGLDPALRWVAFVGFFSREKHPDLLFEAWLALPAALRERTGLVFAGATESKYHEVDPLLAQSIRDQAARLGIADRIRLLGPVADVEQVYRAADVLAMPSTREAFGMVLVEAMAAGLPVIATRIDRVTDTIVEDGVTGLLVPPRDATALAAALEHLLSAPAQAADMGARARQTVAARYGLEASASRWRQIYNEAVHS